MEVAPLPGARQHSTCFILAIPACSALFHFQLLGTVRALRPQRPSQDAWQGSKPATAKAPECRLVQREKKSHCVRVFPCLGRGGIVIVRWGECVQILRKLDTGRGGWDETQRPAPLGTPHTPRSTLEFWP